MRCTYIVCIFIIFFLIIGLMYLLIYPPNVEDSPLGRIAKNASIFVPSLAALLAAIIALSTTHPPEDKVKVHICEPYIDKTFSRWKVRYHDKAWTEDQGQSKPDANEHVKEINFTKDQKDFYEKCPQPIRSYVVHFRMTNKSGFCLNRPVVTLWVPVEKQTPLEKRGGQDALFEIRSNLYNSGADLKVLAMAQEVMVSNSNLPYWPDEKDMTIWIRMVIKNRRRKSDKDEFDVQVSVNCENADGFTDTIHINPKELITDIEANEFFPGIDGQV